MAKQPKSRSSKRVEEKSRKNKVLVRSMSLMTFAFLSGFSALAYNEASKPLKDYGTQYTIASVQDTINYIKNPSVKKTGNNVSTDVEILKREAETVSGRLNLLLMGVDSRGDTITGRTDAMLVLSLDKEHGTMDILSIPRDSYVPIIGYNTNSKITHAFAYGGEKMAQDTVENLLNMQIDHYAVFNFTSFMKIIDDLGGIEVDVPYDFTEQNSKGKQNAIHFKKGKQTLSGEQALAYARMRHQDIKGDIGRGERQQQVVQATLDKLTSVDTIKNFKDIYKDTKKSIETDVSFTKILRLIPYIQDYDISNITLKGSDTYINGTYYYKLDKTSLEDAKKQLKGQEVDTLSTGVTDKSPKDKVENSSTLD